MKKIIVVILFALILIACEKETSYYVKPIDFSASEEKIVDLVEMNDDSLYLDFNFPEKYKVMGISFQTYIDGEMVNEEGVQYGLSDNNRQGQLVMQIDDGDTMMVHLKLVQDENNISQSKFQITKDDKLLEAKGYGKAYIEEDHILGENNEITLGAVRYVDESGIARIRTRSLLADKTLVEEVSACMMISLVLLEDFDD